MTDLHGLRPKRRGMQAELLDAVADLIPVQSEQRSGAGLVSSAAPQGLDHEAALQVSRSTPRDGSWEP
jgi:hypothetical protein